MTINKNIRFENLTKNLSIRIHRDSQLDPVCTIHILFFSEIFNIFIYIYLESYILVFPTKILYAFFPNAFYMPQASHSP